MTTAEILFYLGFTILGWALRHYHILPSRPGPMAPAMAPQLPPPGPAAPAGGLKGILDQFKDLPVLLDDLRQLIDLLQAALKPPAKK